MAGFDLEKDLIETKDIKDFGNRILDLLNMLGISLDDEYVDHICIRLPTKEEVDILLKDIKLSGGEIEAQPMIGGRKIFTVSLPYEIDFLGSPLRFIEIPYPKKGSKYEIGWEHCEFVIESEAETPEQMLEVFLETFPEIDLDDLPDGVTWSMGFPKISKSLIPNPFVEITFEGVTIKFHPKSIEEIIELENEEQ
jgi:predicted metalloenzyme YecM